MPSESKPFFVKLPDRGLIHIEGEDRYVFLQGLITNDIEALKNNNMLYSCLLTPQGKFLYDFFVIKGDDFILLDCEGGERAQDLYKRLNMYRLRSKITISVEEDNPVYAGFGNEPQNSHPDPRHTDQGWRSFEKPENMKEEPFEEWDVHRIRRGIPDGSRDMISDRSTIMECNIDRLNGVSFDKGCYVGQEVTARMKYRGLAKKHLYPVQFEQPIPTPYSDLHLDSKKIGQMRSVCGDIGLALLKDAVVTSSNLPFKIL